MKTVSLEEEVVGGWGGGREYIATFHNIKPQYFQMNDTCIRLCLLSATVFINIVLIKKKTLLWHVLMKIDENISNVVLFSKTTTGGVL